jgi:hypothetical protein
VSGVTIVATWRNAASKALSTHREATPFIIRESQPSAAQLGTQDATLFHQAPDHVLLTSTEPAREGREEYLKRGNGNNHGGALLYRRGSQGKGSGRVLGHCGLRLPTLPRVFRGVWAVFPNCSLIRLTRPAEVDFDCVGA